MKFVRSVKRIAYNNCDPAPKLTVSRQQELAGHFPTTERAHGFCTHLDVQSFLYPSTSETLRAVISRSSLKLLSGGRTISSQTMGGGGLVILVVILLEAPDTKYCQKHWPTLPHNATSVKKRFQKSESNQYVRSTLSGQGAFYRRAKSG
jgi:hypothetical protein